MTSGSKTFKRPNPATNVSSDNYMSLSEPSDGPNSVRRGMKVGQGSRPDTVMIIAKASASTSGGGADNDGRLEVPLSEYLAFEEAERTKNSTDPTISQEQRALASINARKFLNKWRERWATKVAPTPDSNAHFPDMGGSMPSARRRKKSKPLTLDHAHMSNSSGTPVDMGSLSAGSGPQADSMMQGIPDYHHSEVDGAGPSHSHQQVYGGSSMMASSIHPQHTMSPMPEPAESYQGQAQTMIIQKLLALEAGQSMLLQRLTQLDSDTRERLTHLEANMAVMQANQSSIENGVARILDMMRRP